MTTTTDRPRQYMISCSRLVLTTVLSLLVSYGVNDVLATSAGHEALLTGREGSTSSMVCSIRELP